MASARANVFAAVVCLALQTVEAQEAQVVGHWVGTITAAGGAETPFTLTIERQDDTYAGVTSGLTEAGQAPLTSVVVTGNTVSFSVRDESSIGAVELSGELTIAGPRMTGLATLAVGSQRLSANLTLQRRARRDVAQPQVRQRADYFAGQWTFDYVGAEFLPLSPGTREGTATFTQQGDSGFVRGEIAGSIDGQPYRESVSIGFDPASKSLAFLERRPGGVELLSVASWQSPIAITFVTSPIQAEGRTWRLRRVISVTSDVAFSIAEEYSVDGGPFRRLGSGRFTKVQ